MLNKKSAGEDNFGNCEKNIIKENVEGDGEG